jgi:hypothetical protein
MRAAVILSSLSFFVGLGCSLSSSDAGAGPQGAGALTPDAASGVSDATAPDAGANPDATAPDAGANPDATADAACAGDTPRDLSCTGLYSDWAKKTIAPDAVPYTPAFTFWSDGAQKSRWLSLPPGSAIDTTNMDDWVFPVGTKIWKQFTVQGRIVETRLLWKTATQWNPLVYQWSSDGSQATLLDTGLKNVNGSGYDIPSRTECFTCHAGRTDMVLGFDLVGMGASGAQGNGVTLADLASHGRLTTAPPATTIALPEDATQKAAAALGYLHVNCGVSCHNTNASADAFVTHLSMKLLAAQLYPDGGAGQVTQQDTYTTAVNVTATVTPNGTTYKRIVPGDATHSLLPIMALARDPDAGFLAMPPIVSHQADVAGVARVQAWIDAL